MHYKINEEIIIKSENAAKSAKQTNKIVMKYISELPNDYIALDYGCGKLRYTIPLCKKVKTVIAVDSKIQLSRNQVIDGEKISIISYANDISNLNVFELSENDWKKQKYDVILCCNVLSTIPNHFDRLTILENIKKMLNETGEALITVQYRNSYFKLYKSRDYAFPYYDGWIINNKGTHSFYGLITPKALEELCNEASLKITNIQIHDGSTYIKVKNK